MSDDYKRGWNGEPGFGADYDQGRLDRSHGVPLQSRAGSSYGGPSVADLGTALGTPMDTTGVRRAGFNFGERWVENPDRTLKLSLVEVVALSVLGGAIGFAVGLWLHDPGLWLSYAKVFFWFASFILVCGIIGVTIVGQGTRRGTLTLLFLGGIIGYMVWTLALYPGFFVHFT